MIKRLSPKSHFSRNVLTLLSGTTFAQAIGALSLPILTRLYTPEDFSGLAVYMAILGLITVISCLRLNIAIPIPERDEDSINLLALSITFSIIISLLILVVVLIFPEWISSVLKQPKMTAYLWLIPLGVLLASIYNALQYWASRKKQFKLIARTQMVRAIGGSSTQMAIGSIMLGPFGLIFGHMIYGGLGVIALIKSFWRQDRKLINLINPSSMIASLKAYRRFPIYSVPEALFNTASNQLPILIIAALLAAPEAGFVMLAMRVMGLPMGLLGNSVAQVYLTEAPNKLRNGTLAIFTRHTVFGLLKIGAPPLILAGIASPLLFPYVFGEEWARAGVIVAWMTPWFILQFITSPVSVALHVTNNLGSAFILQVFGATLRIGAVCLAIWLNKAWTVEVFAISGAVFYAIYFVVVQKIVKYKC